MSTTNFQTWMPTMPLTSMGQVDPSLQVGYELAPHLLFDVASQAAPEILTQWADVSEGPAQVAVFRNSNDRSEFLLQSFKVPHMIFGPSKNPWENSTGLAQAKVIVVNGGCYPNATNLPRFVKTFSHLGGLAYTCGSAIAVQEQAFDANPDMLHRTNALINYDTFVRPDSCQTFDHCEAAIKIFKTINRESSIFGKFFLPETTFPLESRSQEVRTLVSSSELARRNKFRSGILMSGMHIGSGVMLHLLPPSMPTRSMSQNIPDATPFLKTSRATGADLARALGASEETIALYVANEDILDATIAAHTLMMSALFVLPIIERASQPQSVEIAIK